MGACFEADMEAYLEFNLKACFEAGYLESYLLKLWEPHTGP